MTEHEGPQETASDVVARRVRVIRDRRGWNARQLAEACTRIGHPELTESVIANIESGRRDEHGRRRREVSVDELLAFAEALGVAPGALHRTSGDWNERERRERREALDQMIEFLQRFESWAAVLVNEEDRDHG